LLGEGEKAELSFGYTATDSQGASSSDVNTLKLSITGSNDKPTIKSYKEETNVQEDILSGSISFEDVQLLDVDLTDIHEFVPLDDVLVNIKKSDTDIGEVRVSMDSEGNYTLAGDDIDKLAKGDTATVSFQVSVTDNSGASNEVSTSRTITVTIDGENDKPEITVVKDNNYNNGVTVVTPEIGENEIGGMIYGDTDNPNTLQPEDTQTIERNSFAYDGENASVLINGTLSDFDGGKQRNDAFKFTLKDGESLNLKFEFENDSYGLVYEVYSEGSYTDPIIGEVQGEGNYIVIVHTKEDGENPDGSGIKYNLNASISNITDPTDFVDINVTDETGEKPSNYINIDENGNVTGSLIINIDREDFSIVDENTISHIIKGNVGANDGSPEHTFNDAFGFSLEYGETATFDDKVNNNIEYQIYKIEKDDQANETFTEVTLNSVGELKGEGDYAIRLESDVNDQAGDFELQINIEASEYSMGTITDIDDGTDFADGSLVGLLISAEESTEVKVDEIYLDYGTENSHILSNITVEDVIAMTDSDNTLKIDGDSNDEINLNLSTEWTLNESDNNQPADNNNDGYVEYVSQSDAAIKLLIKNEITVEDV